MSTHVKTPPGAPVWAKTTPTSKVSGVYLGNRNRFVRDAGVWKKYEEATAVVLDEVMIFKGHNAGSSPAELTYGLGLVTASSPITLEYWRNGVYIGGGVIQNNNNNNAKLNGILQGDFELKLRCATPITLLSVGNGGVPFYFLGNQILTELTWVHPTKWAVGWMPVVQSNGLTKVPTFLNPNITSIGYMFQFSGAFNQATIAQWDTKNIVNMASVFRNAAAFNQNVSGWNVDKVTTWTNFRSNSPLSTANTPPKFR